jgi:hypothetical protein
MAYASLTRTDILAGLARLGALARARGVVVDVSVYGGAALALAFDLREATKDVDAVVRGPEAGFVREAAATVAREMGWPEDWFNDGVKGFLSDQEDMACFEDMDASGGIRVYVPSPEYLFAMKCLAMRLGDIAAARDVEDIAALAERIGVASLEQALDIIERFYPSNRIPAKTRFGLEEILGRIAQGKESGHAQS